MRYQDQIVKLTQKAMEDICRAALALPEDRREWSAGGHARSVLSQMREIATSAGFFLPILAGKAPDFSEHAMRQAKLLSNTFSTVEDCVAAARSTLPELCRAMSDLPNEHLEDEITLPFGGGMTITMADLMALPYWNMTYHLGQINQIQLIGGDREMH